MDIIKALAEELNIGRHQAEAAVKLIELNWKNRSGKQQL